MKDRGTQNRCNCLEMGKTRRKWLDVLKPGVKATAMVCRAAPAQKRWREAALGIVSVK